MASWPLKAARWRGVHWYCGGAGGGGELWEGRARWWNGRDDVDEESDWGSHELGVDDLLNRQDKGAVHANRLQGLAIFRSRKVVNLKWIAMHAIQCCCY